MRCRCCDAPKTTRFKDDYYCTPCLSSIKEAIAEDNITFSKGENMTFTEMPYEDTRRERERTKPISLQKERG